MRFFMLYFRIILFLSLSFSFFIPPDFDGAEPVNRTERVKKSPNRPLSIVLLKPFITRLVSAQPFIHLIQGKHHLTLLFFSFHFFLLFFFSSRTATFIVKIHRWRERKSWPNITVSVKWQCNEVNNNGNRKHRKKCVTKSNHLTWMIWVDGTMYNLYNVDTLVQQYTIYVWY